jgi:hypothetical protein
VKAIELWHCGYDATEHAAARPEQKPSRAVSMQADGRYDSMNSAMRTPGRSPSENAPGAETSCHSTDTSRLAAVASRRPNNEFACDPDFVR